MKTDFDKSFFAVVAVRCGVEIFNSIFSKKFCKLWLFIKITSIFKIHNKLTKPNCDIFKNRKRTSNHRRHLQFFIFSLRSLESLDNPPVLPPPYRERPARISSFHEVFIQRKPKPALLQSTLQLTMHVVKWRFFADIWCWCKYIFQRLTKIKKILNEIFLHWRPTFLSWLNDWKLVNFWNSRSVKVDPLVNVGLNALPIHSPLIFALPLHALLILHYLRMYYTVYTCVWPRWMNVLSHLPNEKLWFCTKRLAHLLTSIF